MFSLTTATELGRRGTLNTAHGPIETPFFMPVGTAGAMKGLTHADIEELGAQILLCNTYHLHLNPGEESIESAGGLHNFISWQKPILTDSGGFQVFSLRKIRRITDEGVHFRSHLSGDPLFLGPKSAIEIQHKLGADIIMCFDECPASTASRTEIVTAVDRTLQWAKQCKAVHEKLTEKIQKGQRKQKEQRTNAPFVPSAPSLFGIVQGGLDATLRKKCTEELIAIGFDGYAIGGLAVGESEEEMYDMLDVVCPLLPEDAPRYLMGVGIVEQLRTCVAKGIDMFDCVLPMRIARHGTIILSTGEQLRITNAKYKDAYEPIDPDSPSDLSQKHSRSYLHYLFKAGERLAETIACKQNLAVTLKAMQDLRSHIQS